MSASTKDRATSSNRLNFQQPNVSSNTINEEKTDSLGSNRRIWLDILEEVKELNAELETWKKKNEQTETTLKQTELVRDKLSLRVQDCERTIAEKTTVIGKLSNDLKAAANTIRSIQTNLAETRTEAQRKIEALNQDSWARCDSLSATYQEQILKLQAEIVRISSLSKTESERLHATIESLRTSHSVEIQKLRSESETRLQQLRSELTNENARIITEAQKRIRQATERYASAEQATQALSTKSTHLEKALRTSEDKLSQVTLSYEKIKDRFALLQDQYLMTLQERELLETKLNQIIDKYKIQSEVSETELKKAIETKAVENAALKKEVHRLKSALPLTKLLEQKRELIRKLFSESRNQVNPEVQEEIRKTIGYLEQECQGIQELVNYRDQIK